jgi:hypothetical protein
MGGVPSYSHTDLRLMGTRARPAYPGTLEADDQGIAMSRELMGGSAPDDARREDHHHEGPSLAEQRRQLQERAQALGATADELEAALEVLALEAERVLHRLRGGSLH